ncbi:DUF424 family protein [Candidatus Pacearchaeota archaeon]|nr:DUF424 family protein [Candidatus Pacearchaeota archaeon]
MQVKIHEAYRIVVAVCDTELLGKYFSEGIKQIDIKEGFFKGEEKNFKETVELLIELNKEDATFNIIGQESVKAALEAKIISPEGIITIDNIPVALVLM